MEFFDKGCDIYVEIITHKICLKDCIFVYDVEENLLSRRICLQQDNDCNQFNYLMLIILSLYLYLMLFVLE